MHSSDSNNLGEVILVLHLTDLSKHSLYCDLCRLAYLDLTVGQDRAQRIADPRLLLIKSRQRIVVVRLLHRLTLRFEQIQRDNAGEENPVAEEVQPILYDQEQQRRDPRQGRKPT